jgi:hypothetical protein
MYKCIITSTEEGYENAFMYKCIITIIHLYIKAFS